MPQPPLLAEQGKPSQGTAGEPQPPPRGAAPTWSQPLPAALVEGVPAPNVGTPSAAAPAHGSGHCSGHASLQPAQKARSCCGFCLPFFSSFSFMAGSLLCISNSNRVTQVIIQLPLGPGTCRTWTRFSHLASREEGGRDTKGSIPSAPEANKWHRLTPAATETCRNYLGFTRSHGDKLLHVFLSVGKWFHPPVPPPPSGAVGTVPICSLSQMSQSLQEHTQGQEAPETCQPPWDHSSETNIE